MGKLNTGNCLRGNLSILRNEFLRRVKAGLRLPVIPRHVGELGGDGLWMFYPLPCSVNPFKLLNRTGILKKQLCWNSLPLVSECRLHLAELWLCWKLCSWKELQVKAESEIPGLSWQMEWLWNGATSAVCSKGPHTGELELTFVWEGEIVLRRAQALQHGAFLPWAPIPPLPLTDKPSAGIQAHRISLSFQNQGLLPWGREPSLSQQHSKPVQPCSRAWLQLILGASCCSRGNQCSFVRHSWQEIHPLKLVASLERHWMNGWAHSPFPS